MKWLNRFLIFLLIVIVCISIGLSIYYFMRNTEVFSFGNGENALTKYVNVGETFEVTVTRQNASSEEYSLVTMDENVVRALDPAYYEDDNETIVWRFEAVSGGNTTLQLQTTNEGYKDLQVAVYVGDGTVEHPFYVRDYLDLSTIGQNDAVDGRTLSAHYQQVADIDMSVAESAWTPIGTNSSTGFTGSYNGNGHTISNLILLKSGSTYANESTMFVSDTLERAGLFATIGNGGVVSKLNLTSVIIDGAYSYAGAVAGVVNGQVNFVNVSNSTISNSSTQNGATVGGIVGSVIASSTNTTQFIARIQYSSVSNSTIIGQNYVGGLAGSTQGAFVFNSYVTGNITANGDSSIAGGLIGLVNNVQNENNIYRNAIVNNYAVLSSITSNGEFGYLIGSNTNYGAETNVVLRPSSEDETVSSYNRILGNFYRATDGYTAIAGQADVTDAYLAFPVSDEVLKQRPTQERIDAIISSGAVDASLAFVGYSTIGQFTGWNFEQVWTIDSTVNNGYPTIKVDAVPTADSIYDEFDRIIISAEDALKREIQNDIADDGELNNNYFINESICLTGEWTPIGTAEMPFNGQFVVIPDSNGNMPVIYNLVISTDRAYNGFFGYVGSNGLIQDLTIEGVNISAGQYIGVIAGYNNGTISGATVRSNADTNFVGINVDKDGDVYVGGIVGSNYSNGNILNSTATLNIRVTANTASIGGVAGQNLGNINNASYNGLQANGNYSYRIDVMNKNGNTKYVGGIVGDMSSGTITKGNFTGLISAPTIDGTIVGGIVGRYSGSIANTQPTITKCAATDINITGYLIGGLVGRLDVASSVGIVNNISQSYSTGSVYGYRVGGLAGEISRGSIINSYSNCFLSGNIMGGFAGSILYRNSSEYGRVAYCFSNVSFDNSAGKAYAETESEIYALNNIFDAGSKVGGYVENCILNSQSGGARHSSSYLFIIDWKAPDDGWRSDGDCKNIDTFTNRGFDSSIWNFVSGQYPTLNMN